MTFDTLTRIVNTSTVLTRGEKNLLRDVLGLDTVPVRIDRAAADRGLTVDAVRRLSASLTRRAIDAATL